MIGRIIKMALIILLFAATAYAYSGTFTQITSYGDGTLALKSDGTVWQIYQNQVTQIAGLTNVVKIAGSDCNGAALKSDGTVWVWGFNYNGQLGNGTVDYNFHPEPTQVSGLTGVANIAIGGDGMTGYTVLALKSDGTVFSWGWNQFGELGQGPTGPMDWAAHPTPGQVVGPGGIGYLTDIVAVAVGSGHCIALKSDGTVWHWGSLEYNSNYDFGPYPADDRWYTEPPVQIMKADGSPMIAVKIAASEDNSTFLDSQGQVWSWGDDQHGQLGDGHWDVMTLTRNLTRDHRQFNAVQVCDPANPTGAYLTNVIDISMGGFDTCVIQKGGAAFGWGYNVNGQLGNWTTGADTTGWTSSCPIPVPLFAPAGGGYLTNCVQIAKGDNQTAILTADGSVWVSSPSGLPVQAFVGNYIPGDVNFDGVVTNEDAAIIRGNIGKLNATFFDGDLNLDGRITAVDQRLCFLTGDVNHDGAVTTSDKVLLNARINGLYKGSIPDSTFDFNHDGKINASDRNMINNVLNGFPIIPSAAVATVESAPVVQAPAGDTAVAAKMEVQAQQAKQVKETGGSSGRAKRSVELNNFMNGESLYDVLKK